MKPSSRTLTTSAVAQAAGVPEQTVRQLANRGIIVAERDSNNRRLFAPEAVITVRAYRKARRA